MLSENSPRLTSPLLLCTWLLVAAAWLTSCAPLPPEARTRPPRQVSADELEIAHTMASLSRMAYLIGRDEAALASELSEKGFGPPVFFSHETTGTAAYIARSPNTVVVVFRGTAGLRDAFFVDLNFSKVPGIEGEVHRGFQEAFEALREGIHAQLTSELASARAAAPEGGPEPARLIFAGHSLGSALAQLMALHEVNNGTEVFGVYAFGSPRVGDGCFASAYNARLGAVTFQHKIEGDQVSELPFVWQGYAHTGRNWRVLDPDGGTMTSTQPALELDCGAVIRGQERTPEDDETIQEAREGIDQVLSGSGDGTRGLIAGNHAIALYESLMAQLVSEAGGPTPAP